MIGHFPIEPTQLASLEGILVSIRNFASLKIFPGENSLIVEIPTRTTVISILAASPVLLFYLRTRRKVGLLLE